MKLELYVSEIHTKLDSNNNFKVEGSRIHECFVELSHRLKAKPPTQEQITSTLIELKIKTNTEYNSKELEKIIKKVIYAIYGNPWKQNVDSQGFTKEVFYKDILKNKRLFRDNVKDVFDLVRGSVDEITKS